MHDPTTSAAWSGWPLSEKLVQLAAYHCDELKVHEVPKGSNAGPMVDKYLAAAGRPPGEPWCASFVTWLLKRCGYAHIPNLPAAVASWAHWGINNQHLVATPKRGDLGFFLHADGTGHIFIVIENENPFIRTIEGNSNKNGSSEGYEVVRHMRPLASPGIRFIRL